MAGTMQEIRQALADALKTTGVLGQCSPYMLANPTPPAAHVIRGPVTYDETGSRGTDSMTFTIQAFVGLVSDIGAAILLDKLLAKTGDLSVKEALEADRTLGGAVDVLRVTEATGEQITSPDGRGEVLMTAWTVEVWL